MSRPVGSKNRIDKRLTKHCANCGNEVIRPISNVRSRKVFCSPACYHISSSDSNLQLRKQCRAEGKTRFFTNKACIYGHVAERMVSSGRCLQCQKADHKKNRHKRKDRPTLRSKATKARWYIVNKERNEARRKTWTAKFKEENGVSASWAYKKQRMIDDPIFKTIVDLRCYFLGWFKRHGREKKATLLPLLGCDRSTLQKHIESQFQPGMTWDNHGVGRGKWHVDHKIPLNAVIDGKADLETVWHHTNLQPLWQEENIKKRHHL
jgi:hypothetical protein